jgi:diguanylate cyclase (GGDEF)-like protein
VPERFVERIRSLGRSAASPGARAPAHPELADLALLADARARARTRLGARERWTAVVLGGGFLVAAGAMASLLDSEVPFRTTTAVLLVLALALVSRIEFEIGTGSVVPTQVVLVPMLLLLPPPIVPLAVAVAYALSGLVDRAKGRRHLQRLGVLLGNCWHALAPALLLALFADSEPRWDQWPLYLAALSAQFAFDFASSAGREWFAFGISPRRLLPSFGWVYTVDALLAPVGFLAARESFSMRFAFLLVLAPACLLALLARERRSRIDRAQAFRHAFDSAYVDARRDALTGLANRLAWEEAVVQAERALAEAGTAASVVVLDVDCLKRANDSRGHDFGDEVLRCVAALVLATVRGQDVVARVGGDEVAVLLPKATAETCGDVVTRLRAAFASAPRLAGFRVSAAIGFATATSGGTVAEAQRIADARMYAQKATSRQAVLGDGNAFVHTASGAG